MKTALWYLIYTGNDYTTYLHFLRTSIKKYWFFFMYQQYYHVIKMSLYCQFNNLHVINFAEIAKSNGRVTTVTHFTCTAQPPKKCSSIFKLPSFSTNFGKMCTIFIFMQVVFFFLIARYTNTA